MKPICCNYEMEPTQVARVVVELAQDRPYRIWSCDVVTCRVCGREIMYQFANRPMGYEDDAKAYLAEHPDTSLVYDHTWAGGRAQIRQTRERIVPVTGYCVECMFCDARSPIGRSPKLATVKARHGGWGTLVESETTGTGLDVVPRWICPQCMATHGADDQPDYTKEGMYGPCGS